MASMTVSAKDVSELRARTGAGMMDCKRALEEAGGDMAAAAELLRKKGIAKAEKRAGRSTSQGLVVIEASADGTDAAMIELNSETDFVARNDEFRALAKGLAAVARQGVAPGTVAAAPEEAFLQLPYAGATVGAAITEATAKTGEAVALKRYAHFRPATGVVGTYLHHNEQVGVLVEVAGATGEAALAVARDIALHVASADPLAVAPGDIPAEVMERERRIAEEQVAQEGKPENIRAKIVEGKLKKFAAERALLEQPFVKDEAQTVCRLLATVPGASVVRFARFKVGEA